MANWNGSTRRQRLPGNWGTLRRRILTRDDGVCYICHLPGATDVDHIEPGDNHDESNLAPVHGVPCHRDKTIREREAKRPRQRRPTETHPGLV
jgi:5-methylcytosine-specific restriction protein A